MGLRAVRAAPTRSISRPILRRIQKPFGHLFRDTPGINAPPLRQRGAWHARRFRKECAGVHDHFGDSEMAVQGLHDHFGDSEKAVQGLHDRFTHCERAVQVLHSPATHCEMAAQGLHSHFTHCAGATHVLHTHFTHCDGLRKGGRRKFTRLRRFTPKLLFARYDRDNSPPRSRSPDSLHRAESPPGHRSDLIGPLPLAPIFRSVAVSIIYRYASNR